MERTNWKKKYEAEVARKGREITRRLDWRKKFYESRSRVLDLLQQLKTAQSTDGVIKLPVNVYHQIERQMKPEYRFKDASLVKKGCPHIALTDGKKQIALLIPRKF